MDTAELRRRLGAILEEEERRRVDWSRVDQLSAELNEHLNRYPAFDIPEIASHFLDDTDIRRGGGDYAAHQRKAVHRFVETGEFHDSKAIPWWGCAIALAGPIALLAWTMS